MCSLCFPTCRKLCIAQHPHFPTDSDTGKLVTGVFCTFFFTVTANSVAGFSLDRIEIVCFNYSQLASLTNGCLCVSLLLNFSALKHQKQDHTMCRSFGVKHCARFESHLRSDQTSSDCCRRRKKSPTAKSSCQNK